MCSPGISTRSLPLRRVLKQQRRIPAVCPEAVDQRESGLALGSRPRRVSFSQADVALVQVLGDDGVDLRPGLDADVFGYLVLLVHEQHLEQRGDACRGLAVPDITLDRAEVEAVVLVASSGGRECAQYRLRLDSVGNRNQIRIQFVIVMSLPRL